MNDPDRIRFIFQHVQNHSVVTIMRSDWETMVRADGAPTQLVELPPKIGGVAKQAEVVAIAASGIANPSPGIDVVRKDAKDDPFIYNTDHYTVVENLPKHELYADILKKVGVSDSAELKSTLENWVWLVGPTRIPEVHWSKEIPEYIKNAKKKPNQTRLNQEWIDLAPAWVKESRDGANPTRVGLLDPPMLAACGGVTGLRVLDCGCGEGRFCRLLADRGAEYVLGVDLCRPMIEAAEKMKSERNEYRVANVEDLSFLGDATFDLVVSYLNQCDLPDFEANNREVFRVLKPRGRFIIANLHPMRSAVGGWHRATDGTKLHVILDRYFDETERHWSMMGVEFTNFHRTLATYTRSFRAAGFCLSEIIEPTVTPDQLQYYPQLGDERRVPNFIVYVLQKP